MRKFNLIDAMALVAATAIGLMMVRSLGLPFDWKVLFLGLPEGQSGFNALRSGFTLVLALSPILALWTIALLFLRLRNPRPTVRTLTRQPGFVCTFAVALTIAVGVANLAIATVITWARHGWSITAPYSGWLWAFACSLPAFCGHALAMAWVFQALSGNLCSEPSWIDRAGRALGITWIVVGLGTLWLAYIGTLA